MNPLRWPGNFARWSIGNHDAITAWATVATATAAFIIPLMIYVQGSRDQEKNDRLAKMQRTLEQANLAVQFEEETRYKIERIAADRKKTVVQILNPEAILRDTETSDHIKRIMNRYEPICLGGRVGVYDNKLISIFLRDTLIQYWHAYKKFIDNLRQTDGPDIFKECEDWLRKNPPEAAR